MTLIDREAAALLPCPFCGGSVRLEQAHIHRTREFGDRQFWGVVCRNTTNHGSSCCMEQVPSASKEAAIARWNTRSQPLPSPVSEPDDEDMTREMRESIHAQRTDDVLGLVEALHAIAALTAGHDDQSKAITKIIEDAIGEHAAWTR